ncbi:CPBP family intramembrane glutamic endopeptidase [Candidatus Latescibacterota bacterium]
MESSGSSISKKRLRLELYSVLLLALLILYIRKTALVASVLAAVPVLGASIPFFVLSMGILVWFLRTGRSWSDFGLHRPQSLVLTLAWGVGAGAVRLSSSHLLSPIVTRLTGAEPILNRIEPLQGDLLLLLVLTPLMWLTIGIGEEVLHRGFVMTWLSTIWGNSSRAWLLALLVQAIIFGSGHAYQGSAGVILTSISALIYGGVFILSGRNLWAAAIAHSLANTVGFVESYLAGG